MPRATNWWEIRNEDVRKSIEYAEQAAGADDATFLRVLNTHFQESRTKNATRGLVVLRPRVAPSFHIYEDKRYLRNARNLARRTLGGTRIIGGLPVAKDEFADCVAVGSDSQWACTGTLIADNVVLSAGHCADFATRVCFGNDVSDPCRTVAVKKRVRHPRYKKGKQNDLLILILAEKVEGVARALASKALIDKAGDGRAVGFGATDPTGTFGYGIKRKVDVPVASPDCRGDANGHDDHVAYGCDTGLELVAGRPLLEQDSCRGDSGGPFYIQDKKGNWLLAGATSRATASAVNTCGDGGIYVRVDRYRSWIASIPGVTLP